MKTNITICVEKLYVQQADGSYKWKSLHEERAIQTEQSNILDTSQ